MEYNTAQKKLALPEYGRHVHLMVQHAVHINNREERNFAARSIIGVMGNLQPHLRDIPDFKHKLWDHLFIISDFKLDIDSPYPVPTPEKLMERPNTIPYSQGHIRQRHYGKILVDMIREAAKIEDLEARRLLVQLIANQMKKTYVAWNRSEVSNEQILRDIWDISDGKIDIEPDSIRILDTPDNSRENQPVRNQRTKKKRIAGGERK
ncbi:MAG: DUF4290 domain-containing protein [Bacteroidales bacterium]|jgi:hypothetical protein|nr:DUF4290 domain-containing protein [Bacteroidales bacterium]